MSIEVFTDSAANLPAAKIKEMNIHVIACSYELDGKIIKCPLVPESFDGHEFYDMLRAKAELRTSMTNSHDIAEAFETEPPSVPVEQHEIFIQYPAVVYDYVGIACFRRRCAQH